MKRRRLVAMGLLVAGVLSVAVLASPAWWVDTESARLANTPVRSDSLGADHAGSAVLRAGAGAAAEPQPTDVTTNHASTIAPQARPAKPADDATRPRSRPPGARADANEASTTNAPLRSDDQLEPARPRTGSDTRTIPGFNQPRNLPGGAPTTWAPTGSG